MMLSLTSRITWFSCCFSFLFALSLICLCSTVSVCRKLVPEANVPAFFSFGDSLMDTGNNNNLLTLAKSNFPPYGWDFEQEKATGRFSNGRILSDYLVDHVSAYALGVKNTMPAYLDPKLEENELLTGVNFASASSGYDELTSKIFFVKSMVDEIKMFEEYIGRVEGMVGDVRTNFILNNSIYFLAAGTNDMFTYYGSAFRIVEYDVDSYTDFLLLSASSFIEKLYKLGARKIALSNIPVPGCAPLQRTLGGGLARKCAENYNQAALLFNAKLALQLEFLNVRLPGSKLVYVDLYSIILDLIVNATDYGFKVVDRGCCGSGLIELAVLCNSASLLCENHTEYLYWDSVHPTERAYQIISYQIVEKYAKHLF